MASSKPLCGSVKKKGQAAMMCELCENNPKLKWKCLDCELMMCQRCRDKVHNKISSAKDHTFIDIKEVGKYQTDSKLKIDLKRIRCEEHKGQNCYLYCKTCQELVCQICITKTHNKHEFGNIADEYKIKMEKIRNGQKNIKQEMNTLTVREQKLKQITSNEQSKYDKVKQEILDHDKALKNEIQTYTNKLLKELNQKWEAVSKSIDSEKKKLVEQQERFKKHIQEINTLLHSTNANDVISRSDSLIKSMETNVSSDITSLQGIPKFTGGDKAKIPLILGKLKDVSIQFNTELQVDKCFKNGLTEANSVVTCPDGSLWICDLSSCLVQKVKQNGDDLSVICDFKIKVSDAALLPSGDLLLCLFGSSNLKLIPSGSTDIQDAVYTVSPLHPLGVHVTCDNKVIVGAVDLDEIPATGPRQVIVMDQTGHHEKVFQYDRHNKPLFTYPLRITSNNQGNIAVTGIDYTPIEGTGKVVVLNREGGVRNIYTGHPDVNNKDNPLIPEGFTTSPSDNFIIADSDNNTLHILNNKGEIITFYNTEEIGIILPYSLSFSNTGQLYVLSFVCDTGNNEDNANIFLINNFIF